MTVIDLDIAQDMYRMVLPESEAVGFRPGDRLDVELAVEQTHLFDRDSGAALERRTGSQVGA